MESRFLLAASLALALAACGSPEQGSDAAQTPAPQQDPENENDVVLADESAEGVTILSFLNDGATTVELLDQHVGLDIRAAENLVAHRDGPDAEIGTSDDDLFDSTEEVDGIAYVGPVAIAKLTDYVATQGWLTYASGVWEGVAFNTNQVTLLLDLVNFADLQTLDVDAKLDVRAAENILEARPIISVNELASIEYVGPSALEKMRTYLTTWQITGVTFEAVHDGVLFSYAEASAALAAANQATPAELIAGGISGAQDDLILKGRPWSNLSLVSSTAGIGPLTMMRLKLLGVNYPSTLYYVSQADALEFGDMAEGALRDDEGFGDELYGLLQDVTPQPEWREGVRADVLDAIMERVHGYALARIGQGYSSRDAAFYSVYQYGRDLFQVALTGYPEGILEFIPAMTQEQRLQRAKLGILAQFEFHTVLSPEWISNLNGQTWNDVKGQVAADVADFENGEGYETMQGFPNEYDICFMGRVYGLHSEASVDPIGRISFVLVEID